ncbi:hypothetical protein Godav_022058 [Gossypium davidsonii]|uniref:Uncharacterized protein n=1 Tax=Gossypium davidsonii TaxID=34287 RepID=A0A7J8T8W9_GOSDV|nr:hypothetical protein [Gossypium davidsonii]
MELYEQDECFTELINLFSVTRNKKNSTISSTHTPMDEDVPSAFPLRYSPSL